MDAEEKCVSPTPPAALGTPRGSSLSAVSVLGGFHGATSGVNVGSSFGSPMSSPREDDRQPAHPERQLQPSTTVASAHSGQAPLSDHFPQQDQAATLSPQLAAAVADEERILQEVLSSLRQQRETALSRHEAESVRAQELTSQLVAARRDEDKAMLASDEAVSHALRDKSSVDIKVLERLLDKPYFARLVVEEEVSGAPRTFEYRIGVSANTECRIIDWRRAPISKLYYEYREGEEYSEEIQGRERNGVVLLRNSVDISRGVLRRVTCRYGTAVRKNGAWEASGGRARVERSAGSLPSVLPFISAEQFRTITEEANTAILIQGIAGSGKTTVALHRLAWLLHEDNSAVTRDECLVLALSPVLKSYMARSLEAMEIHGVAVLTFHEWAARTIRTLLPQFAQQDGTLRRPSAPPPAGVERVKRSLALLNALESYLTAHPTDRRPYGEVLTTVLANPEVVLAHDESKLLDRDLVLQAHARAARNVERHELDLSDDALVLRLLQLRGQHPPLPNGGEGLLKHIVVDEVQEYSPAELACIISAVEDLSGLTLVGDVAQKMAQHASFPGWEKLQHHWEQAESMSQYLSLTVSHRSTVEIMRLAEHVQRRSVVTGGRHGRVPIYFKCRTEGRGVRAALDWLTTAFERYPQDLTAVLCADMQEARYAYQLLRPTFGNAVRLFDEHSFSFDEGIVVTDVRTVKGLEFTNALLWNPSRKSYPSSDQSRNALYVAITRAEENLAIVTWSRPSELLPSLSSSLVRGYDLEPPQEDEASPN